jgi:uncharacterized protein
VVRMQIQLTKTQAEAVRRAADSHAVSQAELTRRVLAGRRGLSLADCFSFALVHELHLDAAFAFDRHFAEQGFRALPEA